MTGGPGLSYPARSNQGQGAHRTFASSAIPAGKVAGNGGAEWYPSGLPGTASARGAWRSPIGRLISPPIAAQAGVSGQANSLMGEG